MVGYTQGCIGVYIPRWCTSPIYPGGVYACTPPIPRWCICHAPLPYPGGICTPLPCNPGGICTPLPCNPGGTYPACLSYPGWYIPSMPLIPRVVLVSLRLYPGGISVPQAIPGWCTSWHATRVVYLLACYPGVIHRSLGECGLYSPFFGRMWAILTRFELNVEV